MATDWISLAGTTINYPRYKRRGIEPNRESTWTFLLLAVGFTNDFLGSLIATYNWLNYLIAPYLPHLTHKVLQIIKGDKNGTSPKIRGAIKGPKGPSKKAPGNGTLMGHSKRPKTKVVIKGTKRTLVKASSLKKKNNKQDMNRTNRTSRRGSMKLSKSRKLKPTVRKTKKKSKWSRV